MSYIGYFRYVLQFTPFLILRNTRLGSGTSCVVIPVSGLYFLALALKYSFFFKKILLLDLGGYDILQTSTTLVAPACCPIMWYLFKNNIGYKYFIFALNPGGKKQTPSIELLYRNARWLEREASEFFGFFFSGKADRRVLFTIPLFYNTPFRRKYPAIGFYEIFFCPLLKKLKFKHVSLQI